MKLFDSIIRNYSIYTNYYLFSNWASVHLNLHDVRFLLAATKYLLLGMSYHTNNWAVLFDLIQILFDFFLAQIVAPLQLSLRKSLLFGFRPVLAFYVEGCEVTLIGTKNVVKKINFINDTWLNVSSCQPTKYFNFKPS